MAGLPGAASSLPVTAFSAESVRTALERRFRSAKAGGIGSPNVTQFPDAAAAVAMGVAGPVLDEAERLSARSMGLEVLIDELLSEWVPLSPGWHHAPSAIRDEVVERWKATVAGAVQKLSDEKEPGS